jgi:hypothetical protein
MINLGEYLICSELTHWLGVRGIDDYITEERPDREQNVNIQLSKLYFIIIRDLLLPVNVGGHSNAIKKFVLCPLQPAAQ